jgi:hypothetical protein
MLFGTGFGPTAPPVPVGQIFAGAAPLVDTSLLEIAVDSATVAVQFAGASALARTYPPLLSETDPDTSWNSQRTRPGEALLCDTANEKGSTVGTASAIDSEELLAHVECEQ